MTWRHDGSLCGFLTACAAIRQAGDRQARLEGPNHPAGLFDDLDGGIVEVAGDEVKGRRLLGELAARAGEEAVLCLRDAFLHRDPGGDDDLFGALGLMLRHGPWALQRLADPAMLETDRRCRGVRREAHKLTGFLRFRDLADEAGLYAAFRPDHDVLVLLVPHFHDRLGARDWIIHDIGRGQAAVCRSGNLEFLRGVELAGMVTESGEEQDFQELWQQFFTNIAIPERRNPKLQRAFMPKKYWAGLVERPGRP